MSTQSTSGRHEASTGPVAWSCAEVAEQLGVSLRQVRRLIAVGDLPAFRIGRRVLVRPEDVRAFAADMVEA